MSKYLPQNTEHYRGQNYQLQWRSLAETTRIKWSTWTASGTTQVEIMPHLEVQASAIEQYWEVQAKDAGPKSAHKKQKTPKPGTSSNSVGVLKVKERQRDCSRRRWKRFDKTKCKQVSDPDTFVTKNIRRKLAKHERQLQIRWQDVSTLIFCFLRAGVGLEYVLVYRKYSGSQQPDSGMSQGGRRDTRSPFLPPQS